MYNRNSYFDQFFKEHALPEESYHYYFYVMKFAPLTKYLLFQEFAPFLNKHMIVCVTNRRIMVCEMNAVTGKLTENRFDISLNDVKNIALNKGFMKTKVRITFSDDSSVEFKPNNFCIGMSNHKKHLLQLKELYR